MNQRHTVNQQHKVASTVARQRVWRFEQRLLCYLVAALSLGNLHSVVYFQVYFPAKVLFVLLVVAPYADGFAVDEFIQPQGRAQVINLVDNLCHFALGEWVVAQSVNRAVVGIEDICPVLNQAFFGRVAEHFRFPTFVGIKEFYQCLLKFKFAVKFCHLLLLFRGGHKHLFKE